MRRTSKARGWAKTNKKDADLISLLAFEMSDWWKVWRSPADVRNRREQMRFLADLVGMRTAAGKIAAEVISKWHASS